MFIYILELENKKYYVGKTSDPKMRLVQHVSGTGSVWTNLYPPISILDIIPMSSSFDEDKYTISCMAEYGIDNVRGGSFVSEYLDQKTIDVINKMINTQEGRCFKCGKGGHYARSCDMVSKKIVCYKCGEDGHYANVCVNTRTKEKEIICYKCKTPGHYANTCLSSKQTIEIDTNRNDNTNVNNSHTDNQKVSFKSFHNKYLCFESPKKGLGIVANRDERKSFETFEILYSNKGTQVYCPSHYTYLGTTDVGVVYQTPNKNDDCTFWDITHTDNFVTIMNTKNKRYLCAEKSIFGIPGKVVANRIRVGEFEKWEMKNV